VNHVETARHCLRLIRDIADRGAIPSDPANVGYAEQRQVVVESVGDKGRLFEPVPSNEIVDLDPLLTELQWLDNSLQVMCEKDPGE